MRDWLHGDRGDQVEGLLLLGVGRVVRVKVASPGRALAGPQRVAHDGGEWASRRVKLIAGVPSASRRVWTLASAACERLAGATGSARALLGPRLVLERERRPRLDHVPLH